MKDLTVRKVACNTVCFDCGDVQGSEHEQCFYCGSYDVSYEYCDTCEEVCSC